MFYRNILYIIISIFLSNCTASTLYDNKSNNTLVNGFVNKGFTLVYNDNLYSQKIVNKKIDNRSLIIFQKNLKTNTKVKITNILNNKSLIVTVGKKSKYPIFNNSVISLRISEELDLDINHPYVEIFEILDGSIFIAGKSKTFEEEKSVAVKAPVNSISINDLNTDKKKNLSKKVIKFSYIIKFADFYFNDSAKLMLKKIKSESSIKNPKIKKITSNRYRVYLGPFSNINSLQQSYNDISILKFDNIEIIKND
jgi:hypothetical protein